MQQGEQKYFYFDIPKQERDTAIAFLLDSLLKSRKECKMPSNGRLYDEDVNIYLAHLLFAASLPDYQAAIKQYVTGSISEMADLLERNDDRIIRYFIYKVNADHLMVHLGIFSDLSQSQNGFSKSKKQYFGMAEDCYRQAAEYNKRIYRRQTAIGSVLEKIADGFTEYQKILHYARRQFFHFANEFRDEGFHKFLDEVNRYEEEERTNRAIDRFLDSYAEWIRTKTDDSKFRLLSDAKNLQSSNPEFKFNWEEMKP